MTARERMRSLRAVLGISQSELARRSGVDIRMIQHYEQGFRDVTKAEAMTVLRLAQTLGTTVEGLIGEEDGG